MISLWLSVSTHPHTPSPSLFLGLMQFNSTPASAFGGYGEITAHRNIAVCIYIPQLRLGDTDGAKPEQKGVSHTSLFDAGIEPGRKGEREREKRGSSIKSQEKNKGRS